MKSRPILSDIAAAAFWLALIGLIGAFLFVATGLMVMLSRGLL